MKPALVLLAAGASTRLGTCKALVDLGGRTPIEHLCAAGIDCDDSAPMIVTGAHHAQIARAVPCSVEVLHNPAWAQGRTGGIALARAQRLGRDLFLAPIDTPLVPRAVVQALLAAWVRHGAPARGWLAPSTGMPPRFGHPLIVGRELLLEINSMPPDAPLRELRQRAHPLLACAVESVRILDDLDTLDDLSRLRDLF